MRSVSKTAGTCVSGRVSLAPEWGTIRRAALAVAGENKRKGETPMKYRLQVHGNNPVKVNRLISQVVVFDTLLRGASSRIGTGGYDDEKPPG